MKSKLLGGMKYKLLKENDMNRLFYRTMTVSKKVNDSMDLCLNYLPARSEIDENIRLVAEYNTLFDIIEMFDLKDRYDEYYRENYREDAA